MSHLNKEHESVGICVTVLSTFKSVTITSSDLLEIIQNIEPEKHQAGKQI